MPCRLDRSRSHSAGVRMIGDYVNMQILDWFVGRKLLLPEAYEIEGRISLYHVR